jgi:hypothetical protein
MNEVKEVTNLRNVRFLELGSRELLPIDMAPGCEVRYRL